MLSSIIARARSLWRGARQRADVEREMRDEFEHHIALRAADLARSGLSPAEAERIARTEFGSMEHYKEEGRASRGLRVFDELRFSWLDVRLGARMLVKHPGLTIVGGLGMAVAIAVSAGFFAFFHSHIFPRLPLEEGDRIVSVENWDVERNNEARRQLHDFVVWRDELKTIRQVGAFRTVSRNLIVPGGSAEPVRIAEMSAAGFEVARVQPLMGRALHPEDEREGAPNVLVIGYDAWQARFGGDPGILGRLVRLGPTVHTIVGVMPERFAFPVDHSYWRPLRADPLRYERGEGPTIHVFGRLAPGVTLEQAQAELTTIGQRASTAFPESNANLRPRVHPYTHTILDIQGINGWQLAVFQSMVSLLLVVVAVNVAVLVYARTARRAGEIAVRTALGASRRRIVAQLSGEVLVLTACAAILGLALGMFGLRLGNQIMLSEMGGRMPFWMDLSLSWQTAVYVLGLALLTVLIVGVLPALQATGKRLQASLRSLGGGTGLRLGKTWTALIVAQVAIAVAALPVAIEMGWSEVGSAVTRPVFDPDRYMTAFLVIDEEGLNDAEGDSALQARDARYGAAQEEVIRRLTSEPGVVEVTFTDYAPGDEAEGRVEVEGVAPPLESAGHVVAFSHVDPKLPEVFGARLLAGRHLQSSDVGNAANPIVVTRTFVTRVLGGRDAVGRRVRYVQYPAWVEESVRDTTQWHEVVGVVEDLRVNDLEPSRTAAGVYHPAALGAEKWLILETRPGVHEALTTRLREIAMSIDPAMRVAGVNSFAKWDEQQQLALRLVGLTLGLIALVVFLLSAAGIYALMSFTVSQRRREIGVRVALGALPRQIITAIFSRAMWQLALGMAVGIVGAIALELASDGELMRGVAIYVLPVIALLMLIVGVLAALGPARRGLAVEPTEALRAEG